jgi:hypothetical protein
MSGSLGGHPIGMMHRSPDRQSMPPEMGEPNPELRTAADGMRRGRQWD